MDFYSVAVHAAKQAGSRLLELMGSEIRYTQKDTIDIQAEGDLIAEKIIKDTLSKHFPEHAILAEESGLEATASEFLWVVDPLDGTMNFSRRQDDFAVSIALFRNNKCLLGVVYQPAFNRLYSAQKNEGAFLNDTLIHVSQENQMERFILEGNDPKTFEFRKKSIELLDHVHDQFRSVRMTHRASLRLCELAAGRIDVAYSNQLHFWDMAAGMLIVEEAGGTVTDFQGNDIVINSTEYVATNGQSHDDVLQLFDSRNQ